VQELGQKVSVKNTREDVTPFTTHQSCARVVMAEKNISGGKQHGSLQHKGPMEGKKKGESKKTGRNMADAVHNELFPS